jgi:hypothetical protein
MSNTQKFFRLKEDYSGFKKGCIVLRGDDETGEYFDATTEVTTGESWSTYRIPTKALQPLDNDDELDEAFSTFINENYYASEATKELFKAK